MVDEIEVIPQPGELSDIEFTQVRTCKECNETKTLAVFVKSKGAATGYRWQCQACYNALAKARRKNNVMVDGYRERQAETRARRRMALDVIAMAKRAELLESQGGGCAVCGQVSNFDVFYHLDIAQDGTWRGLICPLCKPIVGMLLRNGDKVAAAQNYIADRVKVDDWGVL